MSGFVETSEIAGLLDRAQSYAATGAAVCFRGPVGCGKTMLAIALAERFGSPIVYLHGRGLEPLAGGYAQTALLGKRVSPTNLELACVRGHTLICDDFHRAVRGEWELLPGVLEERVLHGNGAVAVHPDFKAIFTSSEDLADPALADRMATLRVEPWSRETEVEIVASKVTLDRAEVEIVVDLVRTTRLANPAGTFPTIRAAVTLASVLARSGARACMDDNVFRAAAIDLLGPHLGTLARRDIETMLMRLHSEAADFSLAHF